MACFHISGTFPEKIEKLKRSHRGDARGWASSINSLLFIVSGPAAFPVLRDFRTDSTSLGVKVIGSMTAWGTGIVPGREALLSSNTDWSAKSIKGIGFIFAVRIYAAVFF